MNVYTFSTIFAKFTNNIHVNLFTLKTRRILFVLITTYLKLDRRSALICERLNSGRAKYIPAFISCNKVIQLCFKNV